MVALDLPIMAREYAMIQQQFSSNSAATFHNVDTFSHIHIPMLLAIKGGPLDDPWLLGKESNFLWWSSQLATFANPEST